MDATEIVVAKNLINRICKGTLTDRVALAKLTHFVHLLQAEAEADFNNDGKSSGGDVGEMRHNVTSIYALTETLTLANPVVAQLSKIEESDVIGQQNFRQPHELHSPRPIKSTGFLTDVGKDNYGDPRVTQKKDGNENEGYSKDSGRNTRTASSPVSNILADRTPAVGGQAEKELGRSPHVTRIPQAPKSSPKVHHPIYENVSKEPMAGVRCPTMGCTNPIPHDDQGCYEVRYKLFKEESELTGSRVRLEPLKQPQEIPQSNTSPMHHQNGPKIQGSRASHLPKYSKSKIPQSAIPQQQQQKNAGGMMPSLSKFSRPAIPHFQIPPHQNGGGQKKPATVAQLPKPTFAQPKLFDRKSTPFQSKTRIPTVHSPQQPSKIDPAAILEAINQAALSNLTGPYPTVETTPARRVPMPTRRQIPSLSQAHNGDPATTKNVNETPKNFQSRESPSSSRGGDPIVVPTQAYYAKPESVSSDVKFNGGEERPTSGPTPVTFTQAIIEKSPRTARTPTRSHALNLNAKYSTTPLPHEDAQGGGTTRPPSPVPPSPNLRRHKTKEYFTWLGV